MYAASAHSVAHSIAGTRLHTIPIGCKIQGHRGDRPSWRALDLMFFVKMKVKTIHHHHMYSVTEPAFRCTFGSKWSEDLTFSHQFAVFSTWGVAHRGLWTLLMPSPAATHELTTSPLPSPARHPSDFFLSPQFRDLIDLWEGQSERDIQEGQKLEVDGNT